MPQVDIDELAQRIDALYDEPEALHDREAVHAVQTALALLDEGTVRVASRIDGEWVVNDWCKRAILLAFRQYGMATTEVGPFEYHDKLPLKTGFAEAGVRVVPPATVRHGAHVEPGAILMPSYVNIGAWVGAGSMVDTWATVGSCAQIGESVHLAGGVGIGGVLEPPGARPVIVEDHAFVGSRCIVTEGVVVGEGAVLGALTVLTASMRIIDVTGDEPVVSRGAIPPRAVVIPGTRPKTFPAGEFGVPCALIIGYRSEQTDRKVSLEDALRAHDVAV